MATKEKKRLKIFLAYIPEDRPMSTIIREHLKSLGLADRVDLIDPHEPASGNDQTWQLISGSQIVILFVSTALFTNKQNNGILHAVKELEKLGAILESSKFAKHPRQSQKIIAVTDGPVSAELKSDIADKYPALLNAGTLDVHKNKNAIKEIIEAAVLYLDQKKSAKPPNSIRNEEKLIIKDEELAFEDPVPATAGAEPPPPTGPRFLQAKINEAAGEKKAVNELQTASTYTASVFIGHPDKSFLIDASKDFPRDIIFTDPQQEKETIQIFFITNQEKNIQTADLSLPYSGNSNMAEFTFKTADKAGNFEGEIYAFHKNRLIQKAIVTAAIKKNTIAGTETSPGLKVVFCASKNPEGLQKRTSFEMSLYYPGEEVKEGPLPAIKNGKPTGLYFTQAMADLVKQIKEEIENAIVDIENHPADLYHENNRQLLISLALSGNDLFVNHLKEDIQGKLQIVSNREEFVPLDFVYTIPPPALGATVCKHAKEALLEGKCRGCYDKTISPAPHICPFGFWSFSRIVERHSFNKKISGESGDYFIQAEPSDSEDGKLHVLQNIMYASSSKVEAASAGLIQQVADSIKEDSTFNTAQTWEEWKNSTEKNNPDTLVLMVHVEKKLRKDALEIGKDLLLQNYLVKDYIQSTQGKAPPFIIIIGCEVSNVENYGFDIGSRLMNIGAAAVVSNFTKIRGRQAGPVVMKLVEFLRSKKGENISLGEIMLQLRQYLLANGIMVGLALTAYGDADWRLRVEKS